MTRLRGGILDATDSLGLDRRRGLAAVWLLDRLRARRVDDAYQRLYSRKFARNGTAAVATAILLIVWQPFGGQFAATLGLATAGMASPCKK